MKTSVLIVALVACAFAVGQAQPTATVAKPFAWPPPPEMMWSVTGSATLTQAAEQHVVTTVPADRWLVVTDVRANGDAVVLRKLPAGTLVLQYPDFKPTSNPLPLHPVSGSYGLGVTFEPGTQVVLENVLATSNPLSFTMLGYFVRA